MASYDFAKSDKLTLRDRKGNPIPDSFPDDVKRSLGVIPMTAEQKMPSHSTGALREKLNTVRYDYMPALEVNEAYGRVATFGAKKYETDNWTKGLPFSQITCSLSRHIWKFMWGETHDADSGLLHTDHILWNAVALVYFMEKKPEMDDRFTNRIADVE